MLNKIMSFRAVGWIVAHWQLVLAAIGILVLTHSCAYFTGRDHGDDSAMVEVTSAAIEANELSTDSAGKAAAESEIEQGQIIDDKEKADEAVNLSKDDSNASVASLARMCELVRRSGKDLDGFPACRPGPGETGAGAQPE